MLLKNASSSLLFGRSATTKSASFCALSKSFSDVGNGGSFDRRFLRRRLHRRRKSDSSWFSLNSSLASGALVPQKKTMDACDEMKSRANNNNTNNKYTISRVLRRGENERRKRAALFLRASAGGDEGEGERESFGGRRTRERGGRRPGEELRRRRGRRRGAKLWGETTRVGDFSPKDGVVCHFGWIRCFLRIS